MSYVRPEDADSPRAHVKVIQVLVGGGPGDCAGDHATAVLEWDGERCLGGRWNGNDERPVGMPQSRGCAVWHVMPDTYTAGILASLPEDQRKLAATLLG